MKAARGKEDMDDLVKDGFLTEDESAHSAADIQARKHSASGFRGTRFEHLTVGARVRRNVSGLLVR